MARKAPRCPAPITEDELNLITKIILNSKRQTHKPRTRFIKIRNAFMIRFAYYLGLRPKETRCIKISHIDFEKHELYIPAENNKQNQQDNIPIPEFLWINLNNYIEIKNQLFEKSIWLFPKNNKECIQRGTHRRAFDKAVNEAELQRISYIDAKANMRRKFTLYNLRHSYGTLVFSKTRDIKKTALLLRHYDWQCRTTLKYVHTTNNRMRKQIMGEVFDKSFEIFESEDDI